jgi:hypothetical protein
MPHAVASANNLAVITAKLIGLILKMPLDERRKLLTEMEQHQNGQKSPIRRKHPRKNHFIQVNYTVNKRLFNGFAINLSASGVFIELPKNMMPAFFKDDQVILSFDHPEKNEPLKITGEIARIDTKGIGIKFDQAILDWWAV